MYLVFLYVVFNIIRIIYVSYCSIISYSVYSVKVSINVVKFHLAAECVPGVHFKGCGKIIAKWSLLLRVWFGTTSNVTRRGRTHQGLFFRF